MSTVDNEFGELHWMMDMLQSIDIGLAVIDRDYRVRVWNGFMENHSGRRAGAALGARVFDLCPEIPEQWFRRKVDTVFMLKNRAFTSWEQRPYLVKFRHNRPITGGAEFMFQNTMLLPLTSLDGGVHHVGIIIYDVTDIAIGSAELGEANRELERLSRTDRLTQLLNRGYWEESLAQEFDRDRRTGAACSLVMFDIDHFKKVNDNYGHPVGDEVIRHAAETLRGSVRATDIVGRYGGEEFGVILIDTPIDGAILVCERLRQRIEASTVEARGHRVRYTVSLGVATLTEDVEDYKVWIARADEALYQSKREGRNRTSAHSR